MHTHIQYKWYLDTKSVSQTETDTWNESNTDYFPIGIEFLIIYIYIDGVTRVKYYAYHNHSELLHTQAHHTLTNNNDDTTTEKLIAENQFPPSIQPNSQYFSH